MGSILETLIKEKRGEEASKLNAVQIVSNLFGDLMDREKDVLVRRFGLQGEKKETLEKIGKLHQLTRERVRQIESSSLKKIKKLETLEGDLAVLKEVVESLLEQHGGLMRRDYLLDILTVFCLEIIDGNNESSQQEKTSYRNNFDFILSRVLADNFDFVSESEQFNSSLKSKDSSINHLEELANDLMEKVDALKKTLSTEELLDLLKELDSYNKYQEQLTFDGDVDISAILKSETFPDKAEVINSNKILYSLMQAIKSLERNKFGHWGVSSWQEVKPKTINDKIFLVLKNAGEPLHFTEIARRINEVGFDKKVANPATVHNELILDNRYILTGRGMYGLKEWNK
ncbi:MAG: HTH domain-containing protein [Candidatus Falkowbacteria bacterium]|nr:HTH domain-containing protein [Candidatus Falkowbacteria bacterium]